MFSVSQAVPFFNLLASCILISASVPQSSKSSRGVQMQMQKRDPQGLNSCQSIDIPLEISSWDICQCWDRLSSPNGLLRSRHWKQWHLVDRTRIVRQLRQWHLQVTLPSSLSSMETGILHMTVPCAPWRHPKLKLKLKFPYRLCRADGCYVFYNLTIGGTNPLCGYGHHDFGDWHFDNGNLGYWRIGCTEFHCQSRGL